MRRAFLLLVWTVGGFAGTIAVCLLVSLAFGWRGYTVLSGSMEPAIAAGDVVIAEPVAPLELRRGDVVTFPDPSRGGALVTHRVRRLEASEGAAHVVTQGDANDVPERWDVPLGERLGRVVVRLPRVGHAASRMASLGGPRILVAGSSILLGLLLLLDLMPGRSRPRGGERMAEAKATSSPDGSTRG